MADSVWIRKYLTDNGLDNNKIDYDQDRGVVIYGTEFVYEKLKERILRENGLSS